MTGHNWQNEKSKLNVFAEVYSDIEGAIRSGKMVMVPADEVIILDWTGSGYVILSMEDYSGTYRITGGLNGGNSAVLVNFAFIANAIITAVDMYQLVMLVFALSDAIALTGPIGLAITLGACVLITALLTACIVYYIESVELLFAYHMGSDVAGEELVWQAGVNFVFTALAGMGSKAIGRKATSHAAEALFKALGAEACEKLIDALGVSGASGLVKMLRKAGLLDDAITSMVNGTSKNGLKRLYRCVAQNIPAEMLLYLCNHSNLLDDYTDDVLRMLGGSSYLPGVVYGMLEKYGDDFARVYQRHGDDAIEVLSKHGDELFNLPESYRHEAIDLVMSYGDEVLEGIRKHGDDFMARYVNEGETFVQEYLMKGDEVFESGTKPDGSGSGDSAIPEGGGNSIYRTIDPLTDADLLNRMKDMRRNIPSSIRSRYNFGYAEVDIEGITKTQYYAHSGIKNLESVDNLTLTTEQKAKLSNISVEPSEASKEFVTLNVNGQNIVDGDGAWNRSCDSEFKILNEIALGLGDNVNVNGNIKMYSDLDCCPSCKYVIEQFQKKYPNIDIEVLYKTTGGN